MSSQDYEELKTAILDTIREVPSPEIRENARQSQIVIPAFLINMLLRHGCSTETILDLGGGEVDPYGYATDRRPRTVYLVDPNAKLMPYLGDDLTDLFPPPNVHVNHPETPKGLPAIAMHPGFATDHNQLYEAYKDLGWEPGRSGYGNPMPPWYETLDQYAPSIIAFCAYNESEMRSELYYLLTKTEQHYCPIQIHANPFFREKYNWDDQHGFGWIFAVVKPHKDIRTGSPYSR
jgi:hypothetical protein